MLYVIIAFCLALFFLIALRRVAHRYGLVDKPSPRKTHVGEIPLVGGLAIGGAFLATAIIKNPDSPALLPFVVACLVILLTGLFDDLTGFSARSKFACQLFAAVLMTSWSGLFLVDLGDLWGTGDVLLGNWAIPFTLFCVIGLINAMNMIDGLDGLAGGISAIAAIWFSIGAGGYYSLNDAALDCALAGAIAAFLVFNLRHPWRQHASIFLGDVGSMFLGFVLVWFAVGITQRGPSDFYAISAVWVLGVPIMDTVYLMGRRMMLGQNPFAPDRRHIHHTLIFIGLSELRTLWVLLGVSVLFGAIGVVGWMIGVAEYVLTYAFLITFAFYCLFMHKWREMLVFFGMRHARLAAKEHE